MSVPLFDTRDAAEDLEAAGFESKQAKAIVLVVDKSLTGGVATKADLAEVKAELKADIAEVRTELTEVKAELKADIAEVKADTALVRTELAEVKANLEKAIQGQIIKLGGLMIALAAAFKFFPGGGSP